ncbi:hypothetical protein FHG87_013200 [Trinorchestia longiramus]|nr:hypothetical protein FHG87_013200 [Trinorchestia longiramus]
MYQQNLYPVVDDQKITFQKTETGKYGAHLELFRCKRARSLPALFSSRQQFHPLPNVCSVMYLNLTYE